jgi:hypothetical protein
MRVELPRSPARDIRAVRTGASLEKGGLIMKIGSARAFRIGVLKTFVLAGDNGRTIQSQCAERVRPAVLSRLQNRMNSFEAQW